MSKWKWLRIGLIVFSAAPSFFVPPSPQFAPEMDWHTLAIIFLLTPVMLLFVIGIQAINPMSAKIWQKPDWNLNPITFKDPVQFFHLCAYAMLAQGIVVLCRIPLANAPFYLELLMPIAAATGMLFGIHIVTFVFKNKFREHT